MRHLNYSHLLYFWTVAREGNIANAADALHLTPQTISGQIKLLEEAVGEPLFRRAGRGRVLTETGNTVYEYADEIFRKGIELAQRVRGGETDRPAAFNVGIVNSIPKLIAYRILEPALELKDPTKIICREASFEQLLGDLAVHKLDMVVADHAIPSGLSIKAYNHRLGTSSIGLFALKSVARRYTKKFPQSLQGAPMLLPIPANPLRRALEDWFQTIDVQPNVVAEFEDSALLKAFGDAGIGVFPAPMAIRPEIEHMYRAVCIGEAEAVHEAYFAISPERKLKHPAVVEITEVARAALFQHS